MSYFVMVSSKVFSFHFHVHLNSFAFCVPKAISDVRLLKTGHLLRKVVES